MSVASAYPRHGGPAIVTTLRDAGRLLDAFVDWHLGQGFSRLYLVFDDPDDPDAARMQGRPGVVVTRHDATLREQWRGLAPFDSVGGSIDREVMARQILNTSAMAERARDDGCSWLLHIDVDELFWSPDGNALDYFHGMEADPFEVVTWRNHEAAPHRFDHADPMAEITLFKTAPALAARLPQQPLSRVFQTLPRVRNGFFNLYTSGKSAMRLSRTDIQPHGVHDFVAPNRAVRRAVGERAFILHYACCGFDDFMAKYRRLGRFENAWFRTYDIAASIGPFHLQARDVVMSGDVDAAREFYRTRVAFDDPRDVERLLEVGALQRIVEPSQALAERRRPHIGS